MQYRNERRFPGCHGFSRRVKIAGMLNPKGRTRRVAQCSAWSSGHGKRPEQTALPFRGSGLRWLVLRNPTNSVIEWVMGSGFDPVPRECSVR